MKRHFFTGLVILLPIALTLIIVLFLINLLTRPFEGLVEQFLLYYGYQAKNFPLLWISKGLVLIFLFSALLLAGMLARWFAAKWMMRQLNRLLERIPIINRIYVASRDVVNTLLGPEEQEEYSQVVLVPFHGTESRCIGFMTSRSKQKDRKYYSVFVPATPNPTMGFMLMLPPEEVTFLDLTIEEALTTVISCGALSEKLVASALPKESRPIPQNHSEPDIDDLA